MPSYEHTELVKRVASLSTPPPDIAERETWLQAHGQLQLLQENAEADEMLIHALGNSTFIHTVIVSEDSLLPLNQKDLLSWNGHAFASRAGYAWGADRSDVWLDQDGDHWNSQTLKEAKSLVFGRTLDGFGDGDGTYYEILQEYTHATDLHWQPHLHSYCHFDEQGDIKHAVSISLCKDGHAVDLVSFQRALLEQYLAAANSASVRMFDFTRCSDRRSFRGWPDTPEATIRTDNTLFARQKIDPGKAAYTRGVQLIRTARPKLTIMEEIKSGSRDRCYAEFIACDVRHGQIADISTDPSSTTNYFEAHSNSLPFEVSPVFFRAEVLSRYKNDRDKYSIIEEQRSISCRGGWYLKSYDINEAGQVHVYIVDLQALPYQEQLYWKVFNESPRSGISERAFRQDIKGEWADISTPLEKLLSTVNSWAYADTPWWKPRGKTLAARVNTPHTGSRDEWARAFLDLANLVVEGFQVCFIRGWLRESGIVFDKNNGSLELVEKVLVGAQILADGDRLIGLRETQSVRSLVASHPRGSKAAKLERDALEHHGTYSAHFESVCTTIINELSMIEQTFSGTSQ